MRAVDAAGNRGPAATATIRVSDRVPAPLAPAQARSAGQPGHPRLHSPGVGGVEVAILDELDKVHPVDGRADSRSARWLPGRQSSLGCRGSPDHAPGGAERVRRLSGPACAVICLPGAIKPELTFDGAGRQERSRSSSDAITRSRRAGPMPDPIVPLGFRRQAPPRRPDVQSLHVEIYVPHDLPPGEYSGTLTLTARSRPQSHHADRETLRLPVSLRVWDFTLPDHLSFLPEMNCYGLPDNERDYYRLAHRHRTVLNRVPYNQNGRMQDGCAPRWDRSTIDARLVGLGPPLRSAAGRLGLRRPAAQGRAGRVLLPAAARELAQPDGRQLQRRLLGRPCLPRVVSPGVRRGRAADRRAPAGQGLERDALPGLPQQQEQFQGQRLVARVVPLAAGRAGQLPGLLGASLLRPGLPRGDQPGGETTTAAGSRLFAALGLPRRHLAAAMAPRQPRRPARLPRGRRCDARLSRAWSSSASAPSARSCWSTARPTRSRARTCSRLAWCLDAWSLGTDGVIPWQTVGTPTPGSGPTSSRCSIRTRTTTGLAGPGQASHCRRFPRSGSRPIAAASRTSSI